MPYVEVTFKMEVSDPDDSTGLSADDYDMMADAVMGAGGYDIETYVDTTDEEG